MKNTRAVYQKLREVKYGRLLKLYKTFIKRTPDNCKYNYPYKFFSQGEEKEIRLCLLHQDKLDLKSGIFPHLVDICDKLEHCRNCNAFLIKYTKDDVKKIFEDQLKKKTYPDICSLEWVLEQSYPDIPILNPLLKIYYHIKRKISKNGAIL